MANMRGITEFPCLHAPFLSVTCAFPCWLGTPLQITLLCMPSLVPPVVYVESHDLNTALAFQPRIDTLCKLTHSSYQLRQQWADGPGRVALPFHNSELLIRSASQ